MTRLALPACGLAGALLATLSAASHAQSLWRPLSADGGPVFEVHGNPTSTGRAYAIANDFYVSDDGGMSWRESGTFVPILVASERFGGTSYAMDRAFRLYRMPHPDADATWRPTGHVVVGQSVIGMGVTYEGAIYSTWDNGVYYSVNDGRTFQASSGIPNTVHVNVFAESMAITAQDFQVAGVERAGVDGTPVLYRSFDYGATWSALYTPAQSGRVLGIVLLGIRDIVASIDGRIVVSRDAGATWTQPLDLPGARIVRAHASFAEIIAMNGSQCLRTEDFFATTQDCSDGLPPPERAKGFVSLTVVPVPGMSGIRRVLANDDIVGVRMLENGHTRWTTSNTGLHADGARGLAIAPNDTRRVLSGRFPVIVPAYAGALQDSFDFGASWQYRLAGDAKLIRSIVFDPTTTAQPGSAVLYAAGQAHRTAETGSGIYKSIDNGVTWTSLDAGLPTFVQAPFAGVDMPMIRKVALDPRSCATPPARGACTEGPLHDVYAISNGARRDERFRIVKSTQGGANWMPVGTGLPLSIIDDTHYETVAPVDIKVDAFDGTVYVSLFGSYQDYDGNNYSTSIESGVFRSSDGGTTWARTTKGLPLRTGSNTTTKDVMALALHPRRAGVLWAAVIESVMEPGSTIYRSTDGGAHWSPVSEPLENCDVRELTIDPAAPDVIYASGVAASESGTGCLWRSEDAGHTWTALHAGLPAFAVYDVRQDPGDSRRLVVATDHGVWSATVPSDRIFTDLDN